MKNDPKLVSSEIYEIKYIAKAFGCSAKIVRAVQKKVGVSRRKVYAELRKMGYTKQLKNK